MGNDPPRLERTPEEAASLRERREQLRLALGLPALGEWEERRVEWELRGRTGADYFHNVLVYQEVRQEERRRQCRVERRYASWREWDWQPPTAKQLARQSRVAHERAPARRKGKASHR